MHTEINKMTAAKLRGLRAEKGLTIENVAELSGINKDTISRYENSAVAMQLYILDKIVKIYGISLDIFFKSINDKMQNKETEKEE